MAKYLVTGGAGFIGSHLVDKLLEKNNEVIVIDDLSSGKKENLNPKANFYQLSICDLDKIKPLFKEVDCVFHLAAIPRVPISIEDPVGTFNVNVMGTVNVFKSAIDSGVKRIVFASSSSVYGDQDKLPLQENMVPNPLSPYGLQKLMGEQIAKMFVHFYKIPIVCLRYFNVYGPRTDFESGYSLVLDKFIKLSLSGKPLTVYGDGEQTRAFCFVDDVVDANIKASESQKIKGGEVVNIGSEKSYSVNYLAKLLGGAVAYLPKRAGDPLDTKADVILAGEILGWKQRVDFKEGVEITKRWFELNGKK